MLYFSKLKATLIIVASLALSLIAIPSFFSETTFENLPKWAQRHIVLGLDLQGGSHILLQVDTNAVKKEKQENLRDDIRRILREARIGYTGLGIQADAVQLRLREASQTSEAITKLSELSQPLGGAFSGSGARNVEITDQGEGIIVLRSTQQGVNDRIRSAVDQSIQIVERRINELGTTEPLIQRQGTDRILVQVPGLQDPSRVKALLGKTAKMTFRLVDMTISPDQALQTRPPADSEVLYGSEQGTQRPYLIEKRVVVAGEDLTDAQPSFDSRSGEPVVNFRFNATGGRKFGQTTVDNVGKPFAIVLDGQVISAPVIREPILGGSGQISGNFSVEQANDLAILLRAGALPAPLEVIEERTVGPGLGADSIRAGVIASIVASALVIVFMIAAYGLFGIFAVIALIVNIAMLFGIMALLNATLTLPGIAGVVLTLGMAVDSNVIVYERIREEVRAGRSAISAIDTGFSRAFTTIFDANLTGLIAAAVLFFIGTGPVKGFAITLTLGIFTTMFTAFTFTRLVIATWVRSTRPQTVPM